MLIQCAANAQEKKIAKNRVRQKDGKYKKQLAIKWFHACCFHIGLLSTKSTHITMKFNNEKETPRLCLKK